MFRPELRKRQSAVRDGLLEAGVEPYTGFSLEHVVGTKIGGSTFDGSGRRHSAADLLNYANAANIQVAVYASVERILLASTSQYSRSRLSAIGVIYRDKRGRYHHAMVREKGEVMLSLGAIGSPHLLLCCGIGPRSYLSSMGIPVAYHCGAIPLRCNGISIVLPMPLEHSLIQGVGFY